jgi:hypothetical protein
VRQQKAQEAQEMMVIRMDFDLKRYARDAIVPAVTVNVAGAIEPTLDNWMNANVKMLSSNSAVNTNAKSAKYMKMALYTGLGLLAQGVVEVVADGNEIAETAGDAVGTFMYGLSGATAAEDPVINVPGGYTQTGNPQGSAPAKQVVTRTANFLS